MPRKKTSPTPASKDSEEVKEDTPVRRRRTLPKPETPEVDETPKTQVDQAPVEKRKTPKKTTKTQEKIEESLDARADTLVKKILSAADNSDRQEVLKEIQDKDQELYSLTVGKLKDLRDSAAKQSEQEELEALDNQPEAEFVEPPEEPEEETVSKPELAGEIPLDFVDPLEGAAKKPKYTRYTRRNTWKGGDRYGDAR